MMRSILLLILMLISSGILYSQDFKKYKVEHHHSKNSNFQNNHIRDIFIDESGRTWVTTSGFGLYLYNETDNTFEKKEFSNYNRSGWLNDIEQDGQGRLVITGVVGYLMFYHPEKDQWDSLKMPSGEQSWTLGMNHKGNYLIGSTISNKALLQFRNNQFEKIETDLEDVMGINILPNGDAFVSFRHGVVRYKMLPDGSYSATSSEKIFDLGTYNAVEAKDGTVWVTAFEGGHIHKITSKYTKEIESLPKKVDYDYNGVMTYINHNITVCPDGRILISTQFGNHVVVRNSDSNWEVYSLPMMPKGENADGIERVVWDYRDSSLWMASWGNGLYHWVPNHNKTREQTPQILDTIDILVKAGINYIPDVTRKARTVQVYKTTTAPARLEIWDAQRVDGDTVSVYVNGKLILDRYALTAEKLVLDVVFASGENEILLYAHNLGEIPPNTMAMILSFNKQQHRVTLRSDEDYCERVVVVYDDKNP